MTYTIHDIAKVICNTGQPLTDQQITYLVIDSRQVLFPAQTLFFALSSERRDGHTFIAQLVEQGVKNFVVRKGFNHSAFSGLNFLEVDDVLIALQELSVAHRQKLNSLSNGKPLPVIGITGSNGKTIVKEWLNQLLAPDFRVVRSPRSFNSQIGVPLSVWQINEQHTLGIFEAGISTIHEMERLESIILPTIGVLTNLGEAHAEGFSNRQEKLTEKLKLFVHAKQLVVALDSLLPNEQKVLKNEFPNAFTWSRVDAANLKVVSEIGSNQCTHITALVHEQAHQITIPFTDQISIDNAVTCWSVLIVLGYSPAIIQERILLLEPVDMRMQLKSGINNCYLINDSYSNDLSSLSLALAYLKQQAGNQKTTIILSDILQAGISDEKVYQQVALEMAQRGIDRLIAIGPRISKFQSVFNNVVASCQFYASTEVFLQEATTHLFHSEYVLLKGARVFEFERISKWLELLQHQTVMEINLSAMVFNLKAYQQKLLPTTRVMAMVKAFSYGSGSVEVARLLEFHKVDYLAVAYADEGVALRKAGIHLPIMVMSADEASFDSLLNYHLEPEIFAFSIYGSFHAYLKKQGVLSFPIHLKLNTGMNRLGFEVADAAAIAQLLHHDQTMVVKSVFSHLVASESSSQDAFTLEQAALYNKACKVLEHGLGYPFIQHISNSAAIFRYPELQYQMVRLGIGLYGVDSTNETSLSLQTVATLKSTIAQIRNVKAGDTVGYGRSGLVSRDSVIATVRIGYADGFNRRLGNGKAAMFLKGKLAPVVGNVCMDMTMIDITDIPNVNEGDAVEIFGNHLAVQQIAKWSDTIPYEIMTGISQRVKRVYLDE